MFGLGVFVGRGSTPVLFETRPFQERLGQMMRGRSPESPEKEKIDLKFYDLLDSPVAYPARGKKGDPGEITPGPEGGRTSSMTQTPYGSRDEGIPVKRSKKRATWHRVGQGNRTNESHRRHVPQEKSADPSGPKILKSKITTGKKR